MYARGVDQRRNPMIWLANSLVGSYWFAYRGRISIYIFITKPLWPGGAYMHRGCCQCSSAAVSDLRRLVVAWTYPSLIQVMACPMFGEKPLQWRHNGRDSVLNHQPYYCLLSRLFGRRSKKTSKLRVTGLCVGNSPVTGEFPAQMASNAENVSIWWRHHAIFRADDDLFWCPWFTLCCVLLVR